MKKGFLICPVRGADQKVSDTIVKLLEDNGWVIFYPPRDTDQKDKDGFRICGDNLEAMKAAELIFIIWDGKSQGCLFDAGMAFALNKPIDITLIPEVSTEKSFQNMFRVWRGRVKEKDFRSSGFKAQSSPAPKDGE